MLKMVQKALRTYPKDMLIIVILSVINSLTNGISVVMLIPMLDIINISGSDIGIFSFAIHLFSDMSYALRVAVLLMVYIGLMLMTSIITRQLAVFNTRFVQKYVKQLRLKVYDAVIDADWEVLTSQNHDHLLNTFTRETSNISTAMTIFPTIVSIFITALTQLAIAFALNLPLTAIVIVVGGIFFFAFRRFFDIAKRNGEKMRIANRKYLGEIRNQMDSVQEIKSYGVESFHKEVIHDVLKDYEDANIRHAKMSTLPTLLFSMSATVLIAIIFYASNVILQVEMMELVLIVYIFARIWPIFAKMHRQIQQLSTAMPSFDSVDQIIGALQYSPRDQAESTQHIALNGQIEFQDVSFQYTMSKELIFNRINFRIRANAITALKGRSGAGKSTLVNLLMGLLKPCNGAILIDKIQLNDENIRSWRKSIGYMPQEPIILNKSIRENILRFNPEADDEAIRIALKKAQAINFIENLPDGLDTLMGDKGVRLSGGEKQRIALARALVSNPSVLILDEATSALDNENEQNILDTILSLRNSVTIIVIAHRESTLRHADDVVCVGDDGTVVVRNHLS